MAPAELICEVENEEELEMEKSARKTKAESSISGLWVCVVAVVDREDERSRKAPETMGGIGGRQERERSGSHQTIYNLGCERVARRLELRGRRCDPR